jgi:hypothetical protein
MDFWVDNQPPIYEETPTDLLTLLQSLYCAEQMTGIKNNRAHWYQTLEV